MSVRRFGLNSLGSNGRINQFPYVQSGHCHGGLLAPRRLAFACLEPFQIQPLARGFRFLGAHFTEVV